ncbi:MAG TPA: helix-turn-helix transcriptional regulator [Streptosporangiaceae bacterium]|nr:helix-turn-helix transcriptional regulator [Streptosporangiaceae bacterium]
MAELKRMRDAAGLSQEVVAERLDWHPTKVMRIETGRTSPHPNDVRLMVELYGMTDREQVTALVKLARDARQRGWWYSYRDILLNRYDFFIGLESEAASIRNFELAMIPGLLQTEDYARSLIRGGPYELSREEVERRVEVRLTRQEVLSKEDRPQLWAILDESVIRRVVGAPAIMCEQLEHLITVCDQGRTTVQVVPYGADPHPGLAGSFVIFGFDEPSEPDVVYLETVGGNLYVDKPEETRLFATAFDHLRAAAISPRDTRAMLRAAADALR